MRKLSPHVLYGYSGALGRPPVAKLVNVDAAYVRQVRTEVGPECLIVVRWTQDTQPLDHPEARADEWVNWHEVDFRAMTDRGRDRRVAFEGYNEIPDELAPQEVRFELQRLARLHALDVPAVVLNKSVGTPQEALWATYRPVLRALQPQDLLGLHEYWIDRADLDNRWHVGRFTLAECLRHAPELASVPLVITEAGRDRVEDQGQAGYKRTCRSDDEYLGDLARADALYSQWPNVLGVCVFAIGQMRDRQWEPFNANALWPRVVATYPQESTMPIKEPPISIDGRHLTLPEFERHLATLDLGRVDQVVIHHTYQPNLDDWRRQGGAFWLNAMKAVYEQKPWTDDQGREHLGWTAGPHLYVDDGGVWLFTPLTQDGVGVAGHNARTRHIEVVGDYREAPPTGAVWANAVAAAALTLRRAGLGVERLTYHRALVGTTECPGAGFIREWPAFKAAVAAYHSAPAREPLPEDETATDGPTLRQKVRWWTEEALRQYEAGNKARFEAIMYSLVRVPDGLMYRSERIA
jgi:hypothetical protein